MSRPECGHPEHGDSDEKAQTHRTHLTGWRDPALGRKRRFSLQRLVRALSHPRWPGAILAAYGERFDLLLGRRTYDVWSGFWPKAPSSPMADGLNAAKKYIATHRPESLEWGPFEALDRTSSRAFAASSRRTARTLSSRVARALSQAPHELPRSHQRHQHPPHMSEMKPPHRHIHQQPDPSHDRKHTRPAIRKQRQRDPHHRQ
jgi:hypothetical protein